LCAAWRGLSVCRAGTHADTVFGCETSAPKSARATLLQATSVAANATGLQPVAV
jgi:hypothetical protein